MLFGIVYIGNLFFFLFPFSLCNSANRSNCKGQFPIPSISIGKIHSGSLTLIRLTLDQWDALVCLYMIPSIVRVFIRLIHLIRHYFEWIARTQLNVLPTLAITRTLEKVTWLKRWNQKREKIHELYRKPRKTFLLVSYNLHFTTVFQLMLTNSQPSSLPPKSWRLKLKIFQLELRMDLLNHQFVRKRFSRWMNLLLLPCCKRKWRSTSPSNRVDLECKALKCKFKIYFLYVF